MGTSSFVIFGGIAILLVLLGAAAPLHDRRGLPIRSIKRLLAALLITAAAVFPLWPESEPLFFQDARMIIERNPRLESIHSLPQIFSETYWRDYARGGLYRPLTIASYLFDAELWGRNTSGIPLPSGVRYSNLLLHAAASILVFHLLLALLGLFPVGLFGALLFAVHPAHVEGIALHVGRADLLSALGVLGALLLAWHQRVFFSGVVFFLAMFAKESTAAGILLAPLLFSLLPAEGFSAKERLPLAFQRTFPFLVGFLLYLIPRGLVLGSVSLPPKPFALYIPGTSLAFHDPERFEVLLTMIHAWGEYLLLLFFPFWTSGDYSGFPHSKSITVPVFLSALVLLVLGVVAFLRHRKNKETYLFWYLWFFASLAPASNLIAMSGIIIAERVAYLSAVSACAVYALIFSRLSQRSRVFVVVPTVLIALWGWRSVHYSKEFQEPFSFYQTTVDRGRFPGIVSLSGLVGEYINRLPEEPKLIHKALPLARRSFKVQPTVRNMRHLAYLYEKMGVFDRSLKLWNKLRQAQPQDKSFYESTDRVLTKQLNKNLAERNFPDAAQIVKLGLQIAQEEENVEKVSAWKERLYALFARPILSWSSRSNIPPEELCSMLRTIDAENSLLNTCLEKAQSSASP